MQRSLLSRAWYEFLRSLVFGVAVFAYRVRFTGRENIPKRGGVLVVSNHQSHFDPPLVGLGCPRRMNYVARKTLFRFPPFRWLIASLDAIPLDRDGFGLAGIKESLRRLKRGEMVLIFPEGTRSRNGELGVLRPGFTTLAVRSGAAILPVAVDGAFAAWPRTRKFPRLGRIRVHYGAPIQAADIAGRDESELLAEVERRIRECQAILRQRERT
ncbi:MAG: 1-acyl-sn-glycerol-3-phosphate acyltransferase [Planctomycetaceae bacterium]|nr:1-acyl-sn-glycerol-3-phosphate acyltransferase [Planctomycetaceae bacterium]